MVTVVKVLETAGHTILVRLVESNKSLRAAGRRSLFPSCQVSGLTLILSCLGLVMLPLDLLKSMGTTSFCS